MPEFRITNPVEARRAKYSQYKGAGPAELHLNGEVHFAHVLSVNAIPGVLPNAWLVSIRHMERPDSGQRPRLKIVYS
jgi:hypothetical protein